MQSLPKSVPKPFGTIGRTARQMLTACILLAIAAPLWADDDEWGTKVLRLVGQLNDDRAATRNTAEQGLLELAAEGKGTSQRLLELLPEPNDRMPPAVRDRLASIRQQIETHSAKAALTDTHVSLRADSLPLSKALAAIEEQTGNRLVDNRAAFGQEGADTPVSVDLQNAPFWTAVDKILDQAELSVYNFAGESALALVSRQSGEAPRFGRAAYSGPFRFEATEVQAQRSLRKPKRTSLKVGLEVAWEPRLRPIVLSQPLADVHAIDEFGQAVIIASALPTLDVEVATGTQALEFVLPFDLPSREVSKIASLSGELQALIPAQHVTFRFEDLAAADGRTQNRGGVHVILDTVRKNNEIWELHMRLQLDEDNRALESHRGWAFQNVSYLVDKRGEPIDHAGFETTHQAQNEVGVAYLFDLPEGIDGLTWVYETPAAIIQLPVKYELIDIELP